MKKLSRSQEISLKLWQQAGDTSKRKNIGKTTIEWTGYSRENLDEKEHFVPTDFTIVDPMLLGTLDARELRLAVVIIRELHRNNMLWFFDHRKNNRDKKAIASLRKKGILYRTEEPTIHIVNPWSIRRGNIAAAIAATASVLHGSGRVTTDMIRSLKGRDTKFSPFYLLQL